MYKLILLTFSSLLVADSAIAEGESTYVDYECLAPVRLEMFLSHLRTGTPANSVPWKELRERRPHPRSRLIFQQSSNDAALGGRFITEEAEKMTEVLHAVAATVTPSSLVLIRKYLSHPAAGTGRKMTSLQVALTDLNERFNLFLLEGIGEQKLDSQLFSPIIGRGTFVFTGELGAIVLSRKLDLLSVCVERDRYTDIEERYDWVPYSDGDFDGEKMVETVFEFLEDSRLQALFKCDELFSR